MTETKGVAALMLSHKLPTSIWISLCLGLALVSASRKVCAQQGGIGKLTKPLILDGKMTDAGWKSATVYQEFKTAHPEHGKTPSERTEAYLAHDSRNLYVAIRSFDNNSKEIRAGS